MSTNLANILADFSTNLATTLIVGGTSASLQSIVDDDGVNLTNGVYYFTLDGASSGKEFIQCTLTGTSLTNIKSVSRQGVLTTGVMRPHRVGATVTVTDFANILFMSNVMRGLDNLDSTHPLVYDGAIVPSSDNMLVPKSYVDGLVVAGAPLMSTTVNGIAKLVTAPANALIPLVVGDNDTRVPTQTENDGLAGGGAFGTPSSSNKFLTETYISTNLALNTNVQVFTASGTWTKPTGAKYVDVITIGGGGGGASNLQTAGGQVSSTGGGGGAYVKKSFVASLLPSTVSVTVGAGSTPSSYAVGGTSSFGALVKAYGGGFGGGAGNDPRGAGGGGSAGGGGGGQNATDTFGGLPAIVAGVNGISGQGAGGIYGDGKSAEYGGGAGSGGTPAGSGGSSLYGGGGGAAGGRQQYASTINEPGGTGGVSGAYVAGGGGTGGAGSTGGAGGNGVDGTSRSGTGLCGDGGGGGGNGNTYQAGNGGNGGIPGGGAGSSGGYYNPGTGGTGGTGGRGEVIVVTYF